MGVRVGPALSRTLTLKKTEDKVNHRMEWIYLEDMIKGSNGRGSNAKGKIIIQISP